MKNQNKNRLCQQEQKTNKFQYDAGDCNEWLIEQSQALKTRPNKYAAFGLLAPFGVQIDSKSIERLNDTRSDSWILIPIFSPGLMKFTGQWSARLSQAVFPKEKY